MPSFEDFIRRPRVGGDMGPIDYEIDHKKTKLQGQYRDALVKALIGHNGDTSFSVTAPAFGGQFEASAGNNDGNKFYGMQFRKRF